MKYKFRVWDKTAKTMRYDYEVVVDINLNALFNSNIYVFMRLLPHKDKHGNEMWEGDIIKATDQTGAPCFGGQSMVLGSHAFFSGPYVEVIGNEWENPELVELR